MMIFADEYVKLKKFKFNFFYNNFLLKYSEILGLKHLDTKRGISLGLFCRLEWRVVQKFHKIWKGRWHLGGGVLLEGGISLKGVVRPPLETMMSPINCSSLPWYNWGGDPKYGEGGG